MINKPYFFVLKAFYILAIVLTAGCSRSVDVAAEFPKPLMEPFPLTAGVRYPADLTDFRHVEDPTLEPEWDIRLGNANLMMFRALFAGMFTTVVELDSTTDETGPAPIDFIIEPKLEELEFSSPNQSGTDQYVVWLRYNLKLLMPDGQLISDWRITAYGQEDKRSLGMGSENAMQDAAIKALRDAAANIVVGFHSAPGVRQSVLTTTEAEAGPNVLETGDETIIVEKIIDESISEETT